MHPPAPPRLRADLSGTGHPNPRTNVEHTGPSCLRTDLGGTVHPNLHANGDDVGSR